MTLKIKYIGLIFFTLSFTLQAQQGEVTISQDNVIDKLLEYKKDIKTSTVYMIQVYQSINPDRARREKYKFLKAYGNWPVDIEWQTPNYKIWVGDFTTRLEADRALVKIKKRYMNAIILQPKKDDK